MARTATKQRSQHPGWHVWSRQGRRQGSRAARAGRTANRAPNPIGGAWAIALLFLCAGLALPGGAFAGGTGTTALHTPNGSGAATQDGDYISASAGLNVPFHYFVEVPPGLSRLVIEAFDADVGVGGAAEATAGRDRARTTASAANYSLFDPTGTQRPAFFTSGSATGPANSDNAWLALYDIVSGGNDNRTLDQFTTAAYNNNNGNVNWLTNWIETNDDGSATTGLIQITGGALQLSDNNDGNPSTIERGANLTGFNNAILSFDFHTSANVTATDQFSVQVSSNGGTTWSNLETFTGPSTTTITSAYNITSFVSATSRIRFIRTTGYNGHTFFVDNVQIQNASLPAGHWEVRVDMSSAATAGDGINAIGLRAHDGTSGAGGTELNVYADSAIDVGVNPPATGSQSRTYTLFPYITSGCTVGKNDFDFDSDRGNTGTIQVKSRSGSFTQTFASTALSVNDTWRRDNVTGWTTDSDSIDDGIWESDVTITSYLVNGVENGNYANFYMSDSQAAANPPTANPITHAFRLYLPTDAGVAPVKPYVEQLGRVHNGAQPPAVGQQTQMAVTVRVVNPAAQAITFSAANLVTANVPGGGAVYGGGAQVSQGTVTAQPAVGGTGNITWNPGTVAAGATALLTYEVNVTPTAAGQRIPITGTVASGNGTQAKWVDETGNTTQTRATLTFGPLCELAVTQAVLTPAVVSGFQVRPGNSVEWRTASEVGTVGFDLYRWEAAPGAVGGARAVKVNPSLLTALLEAPQGGSYSFIDEGAPTPAPGRPVAYSLVEVGSRGETREHGPFVVAAEAGEPPLVKIAKRPAAQTEPAGSAGAEDSVDLKGRARFERAPLAPAAPGSQAAQAEGPGTADTAAARETVVAAETSGAAGADLAHFADLTNAEKVAQVKGLLGSFGPPALKVGVRTTGIYGISSATLAGSWGMAPAIAQLLIATGQVSLTYRGQPVAWLPVLAGTELLFYGQAIDSPQAADNVYWLRVGPGLVMSSPLGLGGGLALPGLPGTTGAATQSFTDTVHAERELIAATVVATNPDADFWYWDYVSAGDPVNAAKSFTVTAPNLATATSSSTSSGPAHLSVHLAGASTAGIPLEHDAAIAVNGVPVGEGRWGGLATQSVEIDFDPRLLHTGDNTVTVSALLDPGVPYDLFYIAGFDLTYSRLYHAVGDALTLRGDANKVVTVGGFTDPRILVFDISNPLQPRRMISAALSGGPGDYHVTLSPATPKSPYVAASPAAWLTPSFIRAANPPHLRAAGQGADYIVLTTRDLLAPAQQLAAYRAGQGLTTQVVDVDDVMNEWNDGISSPHAIHDFLAFAYANWRPVPRYVVLAGQGTFDYKNNLGFGGNLLPPLLVSTPSGLFASDNRLADAVGNDGLPEMAIGRLPVATAAQLSQVVQKIQGYEQTPAATWSGRAVLVADASDGGSGDFPTDSERLASALPAGYAAERIYLGGTGGATIDLARASLLGDLASGIGLMSYVGHGALDRLSAQGLLTSSDVATLANGSQSPVVTALTCIINRFEVPGFVPLGGSLVTQPTGGAAAVWAAGGLSENGGAQVLGQRFLRELGLAQGQRLGDVILRALRDYAAATSDHELTDVYNLLGDPALVVKAGGPRIAGGGPPSSE